MSAPYDPSARRDTPLALELKERMRRTGPIEVVDYISQCLWHETHGYYAQRPVVGAGGDFITAPEISQTFGELIGLWCAAVWQQMGEPKLVTLLEFGPGRGTLMADALRASRRVPGFHKALHISMLEASTVLRSLQQSKLCEESVPNSWIGSIQPIDGPVIAIANEFLDAMVLDQWVKTDEGWRSRGVGLDERGELEFTSVVGARPPSYITEYWSDAATGSIFESHRPNLFAEGLKTIAANQPLAALLIDYGHAESGLGDTLQAVRDHRFEHPLTSPGEADLSAQVDFQAISKALSDEGFVVEPLTTQAEFLGRLGIIERASRLMSANPAQAGVIEAAVGRLIAPNAMGTRFKVLGVRSADVAPLPGF